MPQTRLFLKESTGFAQEYTNTARAMLALALLALGLRAPPRLAVSNGCTAARARPLRLAVSNERVTAGLQARIASLDPQACLLIDVENLRGLSGFRVSHGTVIAALACWTREWELTGRVVLAVDHGDEQCGFYDTQLGLAFVFAGPREKADDVLVRLVSRAGEEALVVTADRELRVRCRRATRRRLSIASPLALLSALFPGDALLPAAAEVVAAGGGVSAADAATADPFALTSDEVEASQRSERERKREETALRRALPALTRLDGWQKWHCSVHMQCTRTRYPATGLAPGSGLGCGSSAAGLE